MLITIGLSDTPAFNIKNCNKLVFKQNKGNTKFNRFCISGNDIEYAKKSGILKSKKFSKFWKLSKLGKLKSEKLAKSIKLSKSGNCSNFGAIKVRSNFLTPGAKKAFIKILILWYFDLKYHI